jgi:hypothetical protein
VLTGFRVEGNVAGTRLGEIRDNAVDRFDHQVHVDFRGYAVLAQRFTDQRANGQVGYIMIIHDVEVDDVGARLDDVIDFLAQAGKVGGQDRRRNLVIWHNPNLLT